MTLAIHPTPAEARDARKLTGGAGIGCMGLFPAVEIVKNINKIGVKIISLFSLQETAFLSYYKHRRPSKPTTKKYMTKNELISDSVKINLPGYKGAVNYRPGEAAEKFLASKLPECHGITFGVRADLPENTILVDFMMHNTQLPFELRIARAEHHSRQLDITGGRIQ